MSSIFLIDVSSEVLALKSNVFCFLCGTVGKMCAKTCATSVLGDFDIAS